MNIKTTDIIHGEIIDFTHEGNGVLKVNNFTIFASGGIIGDKVEVRINKVKKTYATGEVIKIIKPSMNRVTHNFSITESKGAIPLIDLEYKEQLKWKTNKVKNDLQRIGGFINVDVKEIIGMKNPFRYRNHTQVPVGEDKGKIQMGFYDRKTNNIVNMENSILHHEIADKILMIIREWMEKFQIKAYSKRTKKGIIRHIGIRTNKNNQAMVILVTSNKDITRKDELIKMLTKEDVISIYQNINTSYDSTYGKKYKKIYGEDRIIDYIGDYKFYLSPNSFLQVNRSQAEVLYDKAKEYLDPKKEDIVFDLYCGIGTISLYMGNKVNKVYGVEVINQAIIDAEKNAKVNNITNVEFIAGKSEEVLPKLIKDGVVANKIILDPPRSGCDREVLESIINLNPERIVYVSCNPSSLARDLKYLVAAGYRLVEVQPVDMFPHTTHVECVVRIQKI